MKNTKLYTSYFKNPVLKNIDLELVNISLYPPKWFDIPYIDFDDLKPTTGLLTAYKNGSITKSGYVERYRKETLNNLNPVDVFNKLNGRIMLCYENSVDFCHRKIVGLWLREHGLMCEELNKKKIAVVGSRGFNDYKLMKQLLDTLIYHYGTFDFNCGMALGADTLGYKYAKDLMFNITEYPADWDKHGKYAGYIRNKEMCKNSDIVLALWDGSSRGTKHMIDISIKEKKPTIVYDYIKKGFIN